MPKQPLPPNPSLENLRKQAKRLLDAAQAGDADALARVREFHPDPPAALALHDAQLALARNYGFASWPKLVAHLEGIERFAWDPMAATESAAPADRLIRLACLDYGRWALADLAIARQILAADPELARANVYTAAATGEVATLRELIARDPGAASRPGGPYRWPPLLYACYSRLDRAPTLEAARELLAAGADPDAGFLWCGHVPPFTALTGAFGEGEHGTNQPPHPARDALARALLEAGADPNDGQTLYNCHFRRDDGHLRLLFEFGLGRDRGGPWLARFGDRMGTPGDLLIEELWCATRKDFRGRVELLVAHGVDVNAPGRRDGRTAYESALLCGNHEIAEYLVAHGARRTGLLPDQQLAAALVAGRGDEARALLARHPQLEHALASGDPHRRVELVRRAVEAGRPDGVRLMAALGFPMSHPGMATPLHEAAWTGDVDMAKLLVELGADPRVRDPEHHGTPLGWAHYNHQRATIAYLAAFADVFDAVSSDCVERVAEWLAADPALATARDADGDALVFYLHRGLARLPELVALLRAHGADFGVRDHEGRTLVEALRARGDAAVIEQL